MPDSNTLIYTIYHKDLGVLFIEDTNTELLDSEDIQILYINTIKETTKHYDLTEYIISTYINKDRFKKAHSAE